MSKAISTVDYYQLKKAEEIITSKNYVAWVEKKANRTERGYNSHIYVFNKLTGDIIQFTSGKGDSSPKFSPNEEKLAFLSSREGKPQVFVIQMSGGEGMKITSALEGVQAFSWSPDGNKIAYSSTVGDKQEEEKENNNPIDVEIAKLKKKKEREMENDPKVIEKLVYRSGTSFHSMNKYTHIFIIDLDSKKTTQLSKGNFNHQIPKWLNDNTIIAVSKREEPVHLSNHAQLMSFDVTTKEEKELLTYNSTYFSGSPEIGFEKILLPYDKEVEVSGQNQLWGLVKDNSITPINNELDRSINKLKIEEKYLLCLVEDTGKQDIRKFIDGRFEMIIRDDFSIQDFDGSENDLYFIGTDPQHPSAIWKFDGKDATIIKDINKELLEDRKICKPEEFWLTNPEGIKFQGWFFDAGETDGNKPPLILSIHGGPHVMWNNAGSMWHEWQVSVARGYSILAVNPIGTSGYGEKFAQIITKRWGLEDARDLLQAVDHFTNRIDPERIYITGGSYAGFQTANIIGRDHRFKAACAQRGVYNIATFWTSTDITTWAFWEMGGETPWTDLQLYWDISPISRAENIQTPLLLIHSENDFRVSISQAEELFAALKKDNKEVVFVRYPRDGHELSRSGEPDHVVDRLSRMLDFFDDH